MKIQHARTGLKLEKKLYLRAQKHAANLNHSFASYVVDLIAADLVGHSDTENIPDVKRIVRSQSPVAAEIRARHPLFPRKPGQVDPPIAKGSRVLTMRDLTKNPLDPEGK